MKSSNGTKKPSKDIKNENSSRLFHDLKQSVTIFASKKLNVELKTYNYGRQEV